jgi:hypothetical protein
MMKPPPAFASLEGLLDLNRRDGIDMRPTLLRVLTDLYLQKRTHPPEDERYYTELALRLLDAADTATRAALAARLARFPAAPPMVIQRLARDVIEVAKPILQHSPCLTATDLASIAEQCGKAHAEIIAGRKVPAALSPQQAAPLSAHPATDDEACELAELFYAAGSSERRLILISLDYAATAPQRPRASLQRADIWRLESAALQHNLDGVVRELESTLGISPAQARRIINDETGEPIVVAAKAMALPADVLQRMLLFMNPRVGQSVDRVYELAELYGEISVEAAQRLIAILRDADPVEPKAPRHEPASWRDAAETARRALSEIARRPSPAATGFTRRAGQR